MGLIDIIEKPMISGSNKFPGLPLLPHGIERYVVPGCGSRGLEINKGDEITIVDKQGLQLGELVFFNPLGNKALISLYFPILWVPINIFLIFFI